MDQKDRRYALAVLLSSDSLPRTQCRPLCRASLARSGFPEMMQC